MHPSHRTTPSLPSRLTALLATLAALIAGLLVVAPQAAHAATSSPSALQAGETLASGDKITSPGGSYFLVEQSDGNLVLRKADGTAVWSTGTTGYPGATATMLANGALEVISADHVVRWCTPTNGNTSSHVALGDDGALAVISRGGLPLWTSKTGRTTYAENVLPPNGILHTGTALWSTDGAYDLTEQSDGNLVLRHGSTVVWSTATNGHGAGYATLLVDGTFVVRTNDGVARWASHTTNSKATQLVLRTDGDLLLYRGSTAVWSWKTGPIAAPASSAGQAIVAHAAAMKGNTYCWGGGTYTGPTHGSGGSGCGGSTVGFDCSGLAMYSVYQALHLQLPHYTGGQATAGGTKIASISQLQPGDLAFFGGGSAANSTHVAIYAGNGDFWDSATYGVPVGIRTTQWELNSAAFDGGVRYWH